MYALEDRAKLKACPEGARYGAFTRGGGHLLEGGVFSGAYVVSKCTRSISSSRHQVILLPVQPYQVRSRKYFSIASIAYLAFYINIFVDL